MSHAIPSLYVGFHHSDGAASDFITLVTEASSLPTPWTFPGERPASHAFVVVSHGWRAAYRLDAQPPRAKITR